MVWLCTEAARNVNGRTFYVCGDGQNMAPAVFDTCARIYSEATGASPEEAFSVESSLQRREIEKKLTVAGRELEQTRTRIQDTEKKKFGAWVPAVTRDPRAAQASLDAQRDALLASQQFEQEKSDTLRRLRRREREHLKAIVGLWRDFGVLDAKVIDHYRKPPI